MACEQEIERAIAAEGQVLLGWRDVPTEQPGLSEAHEGSRAGDPAGVRRARLARHGPGRARAQALRHPQERGPRDPGAATCATARSSTCRRSRRARSSTRACCSRTRSASTTSTCSDRAMVSALRDGAPALLDQHVPDVGSRASVPLHLPQRRDQHAARQLQLDSRARRRDRVARCSATTCDKLWPLIYDGQSDSASFDNALELLRDGRLFAGARDDADDPRSVGRQSADGRGSARVLRIPRGADGAVGRPRGDGVHRRPPDRRDARPQRPASRALHRHRRRLHRHGVGSRRARHSRSARSSRSGGCSRARCCSSTSSRAASSTTTS